MSFFKKNKPVKDKEEYFELETPDSFTSYCNFIYRNIGRRLLKNPKFKDFFTRKLYDPKYEKVLKQANLKVLPEEYFMTIFVTVVGILLTTVFGSIILFFVLRYYSLFFFYGGILAFMLAGFGIYNYPFSLAKARGAAIDASIIYLLPYMKILSKELNLSKIVNILDDFLIYKEIKEEFKKIKYYIYFMGYDIHTSIRESMFYCPSRKLSDTLNDLVTISNSGGDIYNYLSRKLETTNKEVNAIEKKSIDTLLIFSQIYVVLLLISPLFFTVMSAILSLVQFGSSGGGGGGAVSSIILLLVGLPFGYVGFMFLVYYSKPLYSRLKPIENESE